MGFYATPGRDCQSQLAFVFIARPEGPFFVVKSSRFPIRVNSCPPAVLAPVAAGPLLTMGAGLLAVRQHPAKGA
jgi:hypothetical protein